MAAKRSNSKCVQHSVEITYIRERIDDMHDMMSKHVESSEDFRIQVAKNTTTLGGLKWVIGSIAGVITGVGVWVISIFITK